MKNANDILIPPSWRHVKFFEKMKDIIEETQIQNEFVQKQMHGCRYITETGCISSSWIF